MVQDFGSLVRRMHAIRLRSPWLLIPRERWTLSPEMANGPSSAPAYHIQPLADQEPREVSTPGHWGSTLGDDFRGRVEYVRRFGLPTNLSLDERVFLVVERVDWEADISLNGQRLGAVNYVAGPGRFDITPWLRPRNELTIGVELPPWSAAAEPAGRADRRGLPGGLVGEVRLEITSPG
jgi:hypothetical protein